MALLEIQFSGASPAEKAQRVTRSALSRMPPMISLSQCTPETRPSQSVMV